MKIAVAGIGYVGLSNAVLLAQKNDVVAVDISEARVAQLNAKRSPIIDPELESYLAEKPLSLRATTEAAAAYAGADYVLVATPTNYDPVTNYFDTSSVESVIRQVIAVNRAATIIVKSTVPVGFTDKVRADLDTDQVIFSPEFLREGRALYDNLRSPRIDHRRRTVGTGSDLRQAAEERLSPTSRRRSSRGICSEEIDVDYCITEPKPCVLIPTFSK